MKRTTQPTQLTKQGLDDLQSELRELETVKLPAVIQRVETARSYGDLSENAEYTSSKEEQELVETRIEELKSILANVVVVKSTHQHAKAAIGSTVHVKPKGRGKKQIFSIVGEFEADPLKGKVSAVSPLGSALMHKKKGDEATVNTPSGTVTYVIEDIS